MIMLSKQKQRYLSRFSQHKLPSTLMKLSYLQFITQTSIISSCFPITHRKWIHVAFLPMLGIFARFASEAFKDANLIGELRYKFTVNLTREC